MADECVEKLTELERLLNDPDVPMQASRVWELTEELAAHSGAFAPFQAAA